MGRSKLRSADVLATFQADLVRHYAQVVDGWGTLDHALLSARPGPRSWSAIESLEHARRANSIYLRHMQKAVAKAETKGRRPVESFHPGWVGARMRATLMPREIAGDGLPRIATKLPTLGAVNPLKDAEALDVAATIEQFSYQLDAMGALGRRLERIDLNARTNTLFGPFLRLKLGDVLRYLVAHTDRHLVQAERAMATHSASQGA